MTRLSMLLALLCMLPAWAAEPPAYQLNYQGLAVPTFDELDNLSALLKPRSGWWWNPEEPGTGLNLDIQQGSIDPDGGGLVFVSYYTYDATGLPRWYTWAGYWQPADWALWQSQGLIGTLESTGPVQETRNGRCIGCNQHPPDYVDSGLGMARMRFTGTDRLQLELGGELRQFQWMEWADGLRDSARCSPATGDQPAQCRWSILEGDWWYRGFLPIAAGSSGRLTRFLANGYLYHSEDRVIPTVRNQMTLAPYAETTGVEEDPQATAAMPMVVGSDSQYRSMADFIEQATPTPYWEDLATRPNTVFFRDRNSGQEWMLAFEGWKGSLSGGFDLSDHAAVYRIVYIDRDTALALAYEDQDCWLGRVDCGEKALQADALQLGYLLFKRMYPARQTEVEQALSPASSRLWPSP